MSNNKDSVAIKQRFSAAHRSGGRRLPIKKCDTFQILTVISDLCLNLNNEAMISLLTELRF